MKSLKLFLSSLLLTMLLTLVSYHLQADSREKHARVTVPEYRPWMYQEDGVYKGVMATVFSEFAKLTGIEHYRFISTGGAIARLVDYARAGATDIIFLPHFLLPPESDTAFYARNHCDWVLLHVDYASIGLKGKIEKEPFLKDKSPYHFTVRPALPPDVTNQIVGEGSFEVVTSSMHSLVKQLLSGRVDLVADDGVSIYGAAKDLGVEDRLEILQRHFTTRLTLCMNKDFIEARGSDFLKKVDRAIAALPEDSDLEKRLAELFGDTSLLSFGSPD